MASGAYRPGRGPLQLIGRHRRDGGATAALVRDPVQRILGRVLAVAPQTAPVSTHEPLGKL